MNARFAPLLFLCAVLAFPAAVPAARSPEPGTAAAFVAGKLAEAGIREGRDGKTGKIVKTATASRAVSSLPAAGLPKLRDDLAMAAVLDAKAEIAHLLRDEFTAEERIVRTISGEHGAETAVRTSDHRARSKHVWLGMTVICTAESFKDGVYSVCAAVGWSKETEDAVEKQLAAPPPAKESASSESSPEWTAWAAKQDFSHVFGPRTFVDSAGVRRYVGIAFADVEGKQGRPLLDARRVARVKASRNLLFSVFSDLEAETLVSQTTTTADDGIVSLDTDVRNRIIQRCQSKHLLDDEVFSTTIVHPLTGRATFVSVAGVEPEKFAGMKLLENDP